MDVASPSEVLGPTFHRCQSNLWNESLGAGFSRAARDRATHFRSAGSLSNAETEHLRQGAGSEQAVLLHPVVDLVARHTEELGRLRLVASR